MSSDGGRHALQDLVYATLDGRATWNEVLAQARDHIGVDHIILHHHDTSAEFGAFALTTPLDAKVVADYEGYYSERSPFIGFDVTRAVGRVVQMEEMLPRSSYIRTEYYTDYLKPCGVETGFGVTLERRKGLNFLLSAMADGRSERAAERSKAALAALVPHFQLAFRIYRNGGPVGAPDPAAAFPHRAGVVTVGPGLAITAANARALELAATSPDLALGSSGRLRSRCTPLLEHIEAELAGWRTAAERPPARWFHLRREGRALPLRIVVYRTSGDSAAFFRGPECLLLIEDPEDAIAPAAAEFADLHGLSEAERHLVAGLAAGDDLAAIAGRRNKSIETIRTQLKSVLAKSGLGRQGDIVRHVAAMAAARRV